MGRFHKVRASAVSGLLAALIVLALCVCATSAQADTLELQLTSGGFTSGIILGSSCGGGTETCVMFSGSVGAWVINMTSGDSTGGSSATMDLSSLNATTSGNAAPLEIQLSGTDFTAADPLWALQSSGTLVSGGGTVAYSAYVDNTNTALQETTLIGTLGPFSSSYNAAQSFTNNATAPYSLTEDVYLTAGSNGAKWSTDSSIAPDPTPAPEPSALLLTGLSVGLLLLGRRRLLVV
jgi:hypothetical protein